ncbi:MAG: hypothetical protein ABIK07_05440 [Planctomycetota bacterium]
MKKIIPVYLMIIVLTVLGIMSTKTTAEGPNDAAALRKEIDALGKRLDKAERNVSKYELRLTQQQGDINENRAKIEDVLTRLTNFIRIFVPNGSWNGRIPWHTHIDQEIWKIDRRLMQGNYRFSDIEERISALEQKK